MRYTAQDWSFQNTFRTEQIQSEQPSNTKYEWPCPNIFGISPTMTTLNYRGFSEKSNPKNPKATYLRK
jgi:hypothetical protein